ncbi:MAG: tRNA 2-thiouridine(34) synthase MnmA [Flavobacteriales bacterium]|jgi:tRNA-specific 2-thiouridylase|nr:tRNA 2-thiouridine(34) synthase MnmA [Flavobacteriales bacterium]
MKRVVVGLSGGVDSSVAAYLLKEQGYDVVGIFMRNWHDDSVILDHECPWIEDSNDALAVAEMLEIPFQVIDFSEQYKERIVDYMFREYEIGRTPNPDVLCNREIKFDIFLEMAMQLDADFVATGHYCQKKSIEVNGNQTYQLIAGADNNKDQSYFLCQLSQEQLSKALFPIGHLQKSEVRALAEKIGLATAQKKDSQGLCFIGKVKLPDFLQQQLQPKEGNVFEIFPDDPQFSKKASDTLEDNSSPYDFKKFSAKKIGKHSGAHFYTIGQRKGLGIGGKVEPIFVIATDTQKNIVYVGEGKNHPGLFRNGLKIQESEIHWVRPDMQLKEGESKEFLVRIRYRQELEKCTLYLNNKNLYLIFDRPQRGIAKGQFAAWYLKDELIGSGVIFA